MRWTASAPSAPPYLHVMWVSTGPTAGWGRRARARSAALVRRGPSGRGAEATVPERAVLAARVRRGSIATGVRGCRRGSAAPAKTVQPAPIASDAWGSPRASASRVWSARPNLSRLRSTKAAHVLEPAPSTIIDSVSHAILSPVPPANTAQAAAAARRASARCAPTSANRNNFWWGAVGGKRACAARVRSTVEMESIASNAHI